MHIIVFSRAGGRPLNLEFSRWHQRAVLALALLVLAGTLAGLGYYAGRLDSSAEPQRLPPLVLEPPDLQTSEPQPDPAREAYLESLTQRIGHLQARLTSLNALGRKLLEVVDLEQEEFDFGGGDLEPLPAYIGGPPPPSNERQKTDPVRDIDSSIKYLEDRTTAADRQLQVLDRLLLAHTLHQATHPAGKPVSSESWISSTYGTRPDPFTGESEFHRGIDFAGRSGAGVAAVAAGVVVFAGPRYGYGKLVEIDHGGGYVTRYGHGEKILVEVGDVVEKGQRIALLGDTGRSTGPHVHFELLQDGRHVDPLEFVEAAQD